jgi:pimeloyl-ACP methyl ester carboxylesterase
MESSFVEIEDLKIHYLEKNKKGTATIFFIHGNSCSSRMWQQQLNSKLLQQYRLIAIDLPGHGKSSASDNPEKDYSPIGTAKTLSQVVRELAGSNPYTLIGFSYGTNVVAEMLNYEITPKGIVLVASCVLGNNYGMEKVFIQHEYPPITFYNETDQSLVEKWFDKQLFSATKQDLQHLADDYLNVSPDFKPALFKTAGEGKISDEIATLQKYNVPVCIVFGTKDNLLNIDYLDSLPFSVWQNKIYKLPNAGHWLTIDNPEVFDLIIFEYAEEVFKLIHV